MYWEYTESIDSRYFSMHLYLYSLYIYNYLCVCVCGCVYDFDFSKLPNYPTTEERSEPKTKSVWPKNWLPIVTWFITVNRSIWLHSLSQESLLHTHFNPECKCGIFIWPVPQVFTHLLWCCSCRWCARFSGGGWVQTCCPKLGTGNVVLLLRRGRRNSAQLWLFGSLTVLLEVFCCIFHKPLYKAATLEQGHFHVYNHIFHSFLNSSAQFCFSIFGVTASKLGPPLGHFRFP